MAKGVIVESILAGLVDSSGNPLSAGKVYSYEVGTTTPKSLYTDKDASSAAANPLILNANGASQVYADGSYKFVVKTSADVTVSTLDNLIFGASFSSWVPSVSVTAPFTLTGVSVSVAKYVLIGDLVLFYLSFTGTAGGTLGGIIDITLPLTAASSTISASLYVQDNSIVVAGTAGGISTTQIRVRRYDAGAFTAGTVGAVVSGFYEAA